jgi:hypothetical protein
VYHPPCFNAKCSASSKILHFYIFRWEEEKLPEGVKWLTLGHKGPYFPPEYEPLPGSVNFYYNGKMYFTSVSTP